MKNSRFSSGVIAVFLATLMTISVAEGAAQNAKEKRQSALPNKLSQEEAKQGFTLLFDGKSLDNFKGAEKDEIPEGCWLVKDGQIICTPRASRHEGARGSIVTRKQYSNFDFRLEYKMPHRLPRQCQQRYQVLRIPRH